MNSKLKIGLGVIVLFIAIGLAYVFIDKQDLVGAAVDCGSSTCFTSLGVTPGVFQADGAAIFNSSITQTSTNSATSTLKVGCIQTTATSTATPIKLVIGTNGATSTFAGPPGTLSAGSVAWAYGTCP